MIRFFEKNDVVSASTKNNEKCDCFCVSDPTIAANWTISNEWRKENPDGDEEKLRYTLAQLYAINTLGPYKLHIGDHGWRGMNMIIANSDTDIEKEQNSFYNTGDVNVEYLGKKHFHENLGDT